MKHYLSVFAMLARGSVWRVLILLCLMAAGQCGRFLHRLNTELTLYDSRVQQFAEEAAEVTRLEEFFNFTTVSGTFGAAFLLICIVLCLPGCGYGSVCGYTMRRLNISERAVFVMQAIYNAMMLRCCGRWKSSSVCFCAVPMCPQLPHPLSAIKRSDWHFTAMSFCIRFCRWRTSRSGSATSSWFWCSHLPRHRFPTSSGAGNLPPTL